MTRAHKIQLDVNNHQSTLLYKTCGCNRYAYNWMLNRSKELKEQGQKYDKFLLKREFNEHKKTLPFMKEVSAHAVANDANERLNTSYDRFFKKLAGFPKFHSKKQGVGSFALDGSEIKYDPDAKKLFIGKKYGWFKLTESVRFNYSKIYRITISNKAGKWFCAFTLEVEDARKCENQASMVGIDLGISKSATCSDGVVFENPRITIHYEKRLKRLNRELSRRRKGGQNWWKTVYKLRKLHYKIACVREDYIHKMTTAITRKHGIVCLEDLNVVGMSKNRRLAKHILDVSFGEIKRQLEYKAHEVRYVDRFFPSSKLCNVCGIKNSELQLGDREWLCGSCGTRHDRDLNAAINIKNNAVSSTADACVVAS
jgi:putative transposase